MIRKIVLWLIAGTFLMIFILSSNTAFMKVWAGYRYSFISKIPSDKYRFGDLYGFSYLPSFKLRGFVPQDLRNNVVQKSINCNIDLYSICDSYLWSFMPDDSLLHNVQSYKFARWDTHPRQFYLIPNRKSVLLIEMVERRVRTTLSDTAFVYKHLSVMNSRPNENATHVNREPWFANHVFNQNIETKFRIQSFRISFLYTNKRVEINSE